MSMIEQLRAAQAMVTELTEQMEAVTVNRDQLALAAEAHAEQLSALATAHEAHVSELQAQFDKAQADAVAALAEETAGHQAALDDVTGQLAAATQMLRTPAYQDARIEGELTPAPAGDAEAFEMDASGGAGPGILAQLDEITDPRERSKFWREHKAEIQKARRELSAVGNE